MHKASHLFCPLELVYGEKESNFLRLIQNQCFSGEVDLFGEMELGVRIYVIRSNRQTSVDPEIGCCFCRFHKEEIELTLIAVLPEYRQMGYGRAMLRLLCQIFRREKNSKILRKSGVEPDRFFVTPDPIVWYDAYLFDKYAGDFAQFSKRVGFHYYGPGRKQWEPGLSSVSGRISSDYFLRVRDDI